jgi:two-component system, NarL family, nitrate/nitrite response regulator NarL
MKSVFICQPTMKTLLIDDHALFRAGIRLLISSIHPSATIFEAGTIKEAMLIVDQHRDLQICLLDLTLKNENGLSALRIIKDQAPQIACVIVSGVESTDVIVDCLEAGAMGFIPKSAPPEVLSHAIRKVLASEIFLPAQLSRIALGIRSNETDFTPRQIDVLRGLSRGLPSKQIARELDISDHTVREYIAAVYAILGAHSRAEAVIKISQLNLRLSRD